MSSESQPINQKVLEYKKHIHENPEIGWAEVLTTQYIKEQLDAISLIEGLGERRTGAVFELGKGKTSIFVRADIDALKTSDGPQHLCGHSTHTAALMGAYVWLKEHELKLNSEDKKVIFLFQPAEEVHPSGARTFFEAHPSLLDETKYGFAIHVEPHLSIGTVQVQPGPIWAAHDSIKVEITGKAVHVKNTPEGVDAIAGAALIVQLFRNFQKDFPTFGRDIVFNFNTIQGGAANNTIADRVLLTGAVRWLCREQQQLVQQFFAQLPQMIETVYPVSINVTYIDEAVPACQNDSVLAEEVGKYLEQNSSFSIVSRNEIDLGVEDFAHFSKKYKTLYSKVGIDCPFDLHDPQMVVSDEATIKVYEYWQHLLQWWIGTLD